MKKILTTLAISGLAVAAFAQGTVNWGSVGGAFIAQTNATTYSTFAPGGGVSTGTGSVGFTSGSGTTLFYYELLVSSSVSTAPTSVNSLSSWADTGLEAQNGAGANGRILQLGSSTQAVANNWIALATDNIILVGWSANLGTTWSSALAKLQNWSTQAISGAYFGVSSVGSLQSQSGNPGVTVFGTNPGQINNATSPMQMNLLAVPEPGTMALAGLGGLSLLAFRRKK